MKRLNPDKLSVEYRGQLTPTAPIRPRKYTLTHSDTTGELFLTVGPTYAEDKITSLAQKPVRERLAESLLYLIERFNNEPSSKNIDVNPSQHTINLSREDLANIVGSATENVIRLLTEFKNEKLIDVNGRKIILLDVNGLRKTANIDY